MRHWDNNSGLLMKMGDIIQIEGAEKDSEGVERSKNPMPPLYPGEDRANALETLIPIEENLVAKYDKLITLISNADIEDQLQFHLSQNREHLFTQEWLLKNAKKIKGLR